MEQENRVVVLIDMDCFYCQVEEKLDPDLKGKPIAVVQYNPWKGGGIIAVNYVARAMGVTRHMRGDEAKEKCPEIQLPSVPCHRGKADISKYREAGKEVARVLQKFTPLLERASIDEAYLDITAAVESRIKTLSVTTITPSLTPNTYALGYDSFDDFILDVQSNGGGSESIEFDCEHATRLLVGAVLVSEIRAAVYEETGYRCSAGIAHNKILAKLVCGMNKPNKQTVLPKHSVNALYKTLPLKKVKHLGGKFGDSVCDQLKITHMGQLQRFTEKELQAKFDDKNGTWLYNIARGVDCEPVQARFNPKSIGCCKQFRGRSALLELTSLRTWLRDLGDEVDDRLENDALENNRTPKQMVVSFAQQLPDGRDVSSSRSYNFAPDDVLGADLFAGKALDLVLDSIEGVKYKDGEDNRKLKAPVKFLGISVGKFEDNESKKTRKIVDYFAAGPANAPKSRQNKENELDQTKDSKQTIRKNDGKDYILKKFFQVTDKEQGNKVKTKEDNQGNNDKNKVVTNDDVHDQNSNESKTNETLHADLDKQESFFAKLLNKGVERNSVSRPNSALSNSVSRPNSALSVEAENYMTNVRITTPNCEVTEHREESNDSEYSGSTINEEINKSIALFDENPEDVVRVSSMRELLNKSAAVADISDKSDESGLERNLSETNFDQKSDMNDVHVENKTNIVEETTDCNIEASNTEVNNPDPNKQIIRTESPQNLEHFECPECNKIVAMKMIDEHADYHLALTLRDEERQQARKENKERTVMKIEKQDKTKVSKDDRKNDNVGSISSFLVKVDDKVPTETCTECGKKVSVNKIAEHQDFHEAQKLNRELNKRPTPNYFTGSGVKKRKTVSPVKKTKATNNFKSIDSFFK